MLLTKERFTEIMSGCPTHATAFITLADGSTVELQEHEVRYLQTRVVDKTLEPSSIHISAQCNCCSELKYNPIRPDGKFVDKFPNNIFSLNPTLCFKIL